MNNDFFDELNNKKEENTEPVASDVSYTETDEPKSAVYSETVRKPKKEHGSFWKKPVTVAVLTAFVMTFLFGGGLYISKDAIKDYILKDVNTSSANTNFDIPGASVTKSDGTELTNQQIAATVSPSIVGVSNMSYSQNSYLNINTVQSTGSGIIISTDGYIVTNNHVVSNANKLKVNLASGDEVDAKLIGTDATTDIAIIKIDPSGLDLKAATLGYSSSLQVGDEVLAIGNPLGLKLAGSVTHGIVSALNRSLTVDGTTYNLIQTDAAINSGNSGGALVNNKGEVIGINSVKVASDGVEGLGFAIPIDDIKDVIEDIIKDGYVHGRPSIGINIVEITSQLAYYYNLPSNYGLFVNSVVEGSAAEISGIEVGDIIIAFNGEKVTSASDFIAKKNEYKAGDTIELTINREGTEKKISVKLQEEKPASK